VRHGGCLGLGLAAMGSGRHGMMCLVNSDNNKL